MSKCTKLLPTNVHKLLDIYRQCYQECVCVHGGGLCPVVCHPSVLDPQPAHCTEIQPQ